MILTSCNTDDSQSSYPMPKGIKTSSDLYSYLEKLAEEEDIPGYAINVFVDEGPSFQHAFGYANIEEQTSYINQTITSIASVSKTMVGVAVVKCLELGYFTLDTEVNEVLPFKIKNPHYEEEMIKIKDLATHTSGIIDNPAFYISRNYFILPGEDLTTKGSKILTDELGIKQGLPLDLKKYIREVLVDGGMYYTEDQFLNEKPGTMWAYSNIATSLMSYIIEYVSGMPFYHFIQKHVLQPLGMSNSTFDVSSINRTSLATLYVDEKTPLPVYGNHGYAEGSMHTNNEDMGKFLLEIMNAINGKGGQLLNANGYSILTEKIYDDLIIPSEFAEHQGLYWYFNDGYMQHGGNSLGTSAILRVKEDGSAGYSIMSNMDGSFVKNVKKWSKVQSLISDAIHQFVSNHP